MLCDPGTLVLMGKASNEKEQNVNLMLNIVEPQWGLMGGPLTPNTGAGEVP